ncbi:hypothetical protein JCGZ_16433 [Jatropha curcas]|uniref:PTM/DIR17-like Tudor domain-containing protein n=1 Tax=Jatropha curcas TaxID=180498 RepID=A0A067KB41_JATCU|nr:dirigent protein 17 [Jatropha curcas]KDP29044.1 hypothetical protein JCGZ_16433 [Jatropha curcas]
MENTIKGPVSESLETGVFELPGEPAIVINGVPDISPSDGSLIPSSTASDAEQQRNTSLDAEFLGNTNFGEWLEGREVQKLFGDQYFTGAVTQFDKETGWYRVVYEDGDFEDLEWHELEAVLVPLDITVPLKSLALKVIKKSQKTENGRSAFGPNIGKAKSLASKETED